MAKITSMGWNKTSTPKLSEAELNDRIKKTAQQLWEKKGRVQGKDLEIWLEAERLVKSGRA